MEITVRKPVFDLNAMEECTLVKSGTFEPVKSNQEALDRVGGNTEKFLEVFNNGLVDLAKSELKTNDAIEWLVVDEETGKTTKFEGTPANKKTVNGLVLTLAKAIYGFVNSRDAKDKEAARNKNKAAKEKALNHIKNDEEIKRGLIENATAADDEE